MTGGILVVDRLAFYRRVALKDRVAAGCRTLGLTGEQTFSRYRGFDGDAWPVLDGTAPPRADGLANANDWPLVEKYMIGEGDCDVIALAAPDDEAPVQGWVRLGFDVGYFQSEWSHYSSILNEILLGALPELRVHAERLNENLLFSNLEQCRAALADRNTQRARGADVEGEDVEPITVFAPEA